MIGPTDLLHPSPAPHLKIDANFKKKSYLVQVSQPHKIPFHSEGTDFPQTMCMCLKNTLFVS